MAVDKDKDGFYAQDSKNSVPANLVDPDDNDAAVKPGTTQLGAGYTGADTTKPFAYVSSKATAEADIREAFTTMFGTKVPKEIVSAYASELASIQRGRTNKRQGTGATQTVVENMSAQEKQDLINKYLTQYAKQQYTLAQSGDQKALAGLQKGSFGLSLTSLRNAYYENGLTFNLQTSANQVIESALNPAKLKSNLNLINIQAKTMFPALSDKIDAGYTVKQLMTPYINSRASILEEDPDTMDMKSLMDAAKDPKGLMSLYDYEISLRKDPKWKFTKNAQDSLSKVAHSIAQTFGLVG